MSGTMSKRQQARNEKTLQELVHDVHGNNICADCHARNPSWASWSLGVFLCMRCAAIHRKLGTHISKVKSLSMDSWSNEQVDNMKKVGNVVSNQIYNAENKRPPVPVDADEADSAMERFIRQKYMNNIASQPGKPGTPRSPEGTPPPLPPKNSSKFGFRSASSIFPLSSRSKKDAKQAAAAAAADMHSPTLNNKPSKVFGATVGYDGPDDTDKKLHRLRDMGFQDSQRNAIVLKGVNGNLERAVEALVRLGEGGAQSPSPVTSPREHTLRSTKSLTPLSGNSGGLNAGLSVPDRRATDRPMTSSTTSTNPFDMMNFAQPQTAHSTGSMHNSNPYNHSTNPFGPPSPSQQPDAVTQAFQGLNISGQGLTLNQNPTALQAPSQQMFQQHLTPSSSPQGYQHMNFQSSMTYPPPAQQQQQAQPQNGYNPFFSHTSNPSPLPSPQHGLSLNINQAQGGFTNNPYTRSPTRIASPTLGQIPEQGAFPMSASPQPLPQGTNPFFASPMASPLPQNQQQVFGQQSYGQPSPYAQSPYGPQSPYGLQPSGQQQLFGQPAYGQQQQSYFQQPRKDNASIMALYGQLPQAQQQPLQPVASEPNLFAQTPMIPEGQAIHTQSVHAPPALGQLPRSATMPVNGTNPFMNNGPAAAPSDPYSSVRHISRESMNLGKDMAWTNGRHSPDAFASLSARHA